MKSHSIVSLETYQWLLGSINNVVCYSNSLAKEYEMDFIKDNSWYSETVVTERIVKRKGQWHVDLVFAYYKDPFRLLVRNITHCISYDKAKITGNIMKKQAAKDQRGTLSVNQELIGISCN